MANAAAGARGVLCFFECTQTDYLRNKNIHTTTNANEATDWCGYANYAKRFFLSIDFKNIKAEAVNRVELMINALKYDSY